MPTNQYSVTNSNPEIINSEFVKLKHSLKNKLFIFVRADGKFGINNKLFKVNGNLMMINHR